MAITYSASIITVNDAKVTGTTSTTGTTTTLTDSSKSWTTNVYKNLHVVITSGAYAGAVGLISSNTATVLTCDQGFYLYNYSTITRSAVTPPTSVTYKILYGLEDIMSADTAGGWGVFHKNIDGQYYSDASITIGNGTSQAGLSLVEDDLRFTAASPYMSLRIANNGILVSGIENVNEITVKGSEVTTYKTNAFVTTEWYSEDYAFLRIDSGGTAHLVDSIFRSPDGVPPINPQLGGKFLTRNVTFHRAGQIRVRATDVYIDGLNYIGDVGNGTTLGSMYVLLAITPTAKNFTAQQCLYGITGSGVVTPGTTYTLEGPILKNNIFDVRLYSGHTFDFINPVWDSTTSAEASQTGYCNEIYTYDLTVVDASATVINGAVVRGKDVFGTQVYNLTTDSNGQIAQQEILYKNYTLTSGTPSSTTYSPHSESLDTYEQLRRTEAFTFAQETNLIKGLLTDSFIVANKATASGYTGISVNGGTKAITVSGTRTIQELYDYLQYWQSLTGNLQYVEPMTTSSGLLFTLGSGWSISVTGSLSSSTQSITGTVTVTTAGFYKDTAGVKWIASGSTYYASEVTYTFKDGATPKAGVWCAVYDDTSVNRLYNTSLALTEIESNGSGVVNGYLVYKINSTTYTGHTVTARQYGYQRIANPESPSGMAITKDILLTADAFITEATEATVAAYTGIALNYTTKEITVSYVGTRTLDNLYDYIRYSDSLQANIDETDTISTPDGTSYILKTDWDLIIAGNGTALAVKASQPLKSLAYQGTGALTITNDGFFEDSNLAEWETAGTIYKASHFYTNVKDNTTSANVQNAVVAYVNSTDVDVTYSTALVNLGVVTDASGNADGYAVYAIGGTTDSAIKQLVGEYDYQWSVIPKTVAGTPIGTAASYETVRISDDAYVVLTKTNALAIAGVTTNHTTWVCDMNSNNLSQVYDNLKARQARTNDIETGKAGYMSYYDITTYSDTGLILRDDGSVYWGAYKWTFQNSGGGGTLKERDASGVATTNVSIDINNLMYCSFTGTDIGFDSATKTISSTTTDLTNFYDGQTIIITGSTSNDGTYTVNGSPIATALIVDQTLVNEAASASVTINGGVGSRVQIVNTTGRDESDWAATTAYTTGNGVRETFKSVTSITRSGTTATVTMTGHGYTTGWHVTFQGATQTEYNGFKDITVIDPNTFTFTVGGSPATPATGTITARNEKFWYECTTGGTTGGTEPTWNNVAGNLTTDGTAVWKTRDIELLNTEATTTTAGVAYEHKGTNRAIRVRVMYVCGVKAKKWHTFTGTVTTGGFSQDAAQEDNDVYIDNNIDGSLVTEFVVIESQVRIYVDDPDNTTTAQRIYNWFQYWISTEEGIENQDSHITAADQTHYTLESSQKIVNLDTTNPLEITGANIVPTSGTATAIYDVTNGASIVLNFNRVEAFVYSTGSGLSATQDQRLTDILADTADIQPKIGTPTDTNLATDVANVKTDTKLIKNLLF